MVMTTTDDWKRELGKGAVPLVVHALIEDAKHKSGSPTIDIEWRSSPDLTQLQSGTTYSMDGPDPVIGGITTLSTSLDPVGRKIQTGEITATIVDNSSIRDLIDNYDIVGKTIFFKVGTPDLPLADFLPYWAGYVFDIIPKEGTKVDIVCKTKMRKLEESVWKGQVINKNKLDAVEGILTDIGLTSSDYDTASFDKTSSANSEISHFVDTSLNFDVYKIKTSRAVDIPGSDSGMRHTITGGSYPTQGYKSKAGKKWPNPDDTGVKAVEIIGNLLYSTYGTVSADSQSGKIKFNAWVKDKDVIRTLDENDYSDFELTEVFGEKLINSIRMPLSYKGASQDFVLKDDSSIDRYGREMIHECDVSFNVYMAAASQGPGPLQFTASDKALGEWRNTENTEAEFQSYFGSDNSDWRAWIDRAYPHAIELGGYGITGFSGTDRMGQAFSFASASTFTGELSASHPGYYWIPDFNVVYKSTCGPALNVYKNGMPGGSASSYYNAWDKNGDSQTATMETSNAVVIDVLGSQLGTIFGSLRLPFFQIDTTSNEPWLPANQVWDNGWVIYPNVVGATQSLFINQLGTTFKPFVSNGPSTIYTEENTWKDDHPWDTDDIDYASQDEIEIYDITQAEYLARQILDRSSNGMPTVEFKTGLGHMDLELGDFLRIENTGIFLWRGIPCQDCKFEITGKTVDLYSGEVQFECTFASLDPLVFPTTITSNVSRFGLGDSNYQSFLNWENLQRLAGIDFGLKPSLLAQKGAATKFPFIGPGKVSGGAGGPKVLNAGALMTGFPPLDYKTGVEQHVYYGIDTRSGQVESYSKDTSDDTCGFMANNRKVIPIMRVTKTTSDELDDSSLVDLRDLGGYSNPGNQNPMSESEIRIGPKNGDVSIWGSSRNLPEGWGATTLAGYPLSIWDEDSVIIGEVGSNPPTTGDMGSQFFERSTITKTGKYSIKLNSIDSSNTYTANGVTKKIVPYQWKVITPTIKGLQIGTNYSFTLGCQSSGTGTSFTMDLERIDSDGNWNAPVGWKDRNISISDADEWHNETFINYIPSYEGDRSVRLAISFTGYDKDELIIDSFSVQNPSINPRMITELGDVSTATSNNAILRWDSTAAQAEWSPYSDYVFRAEGDNYPATVGTVSSVELKWEDAEINTHATYYDPLRGTLATFPAVTNKKWYCPATGYWRVRARCESRTISNTSLIGDNSPYESVRMKMIAYKYSYADTLITTLESSKILITGSPSYSWDGTNNGFFLLETIFEISQSEYVIVNVINDDSSNTYTLSDIGSCFEITPVLIE